MNNCSRYKKEHYPAQALVIAMIVVVLSVIVGIGVFSRILKDKQSAIEEQSSSEALEVSNSVINVFATLDNDKLFNDVEDKTEVRLTNENELMTYLFDLGVEDIKSEMFGQCTGTLSDINVHMDIAQGENVEIGENQVLGYYLGEDAMEVKNGCNLNLTFETRGSSSVGVIIHKVYGKNYPNTKYKDYDLNDILAYCVSDNATCENEKLDKVDSWVYQTTEDSLDIDLREMSGDYYLDEIRIVPIGGDVAVKSVLNEDWCAGDMDLRMVHVVVAVNCSGTSRGKEILIPRSKNLTYSPIFDYTIYNKNGILQLY